MAGRAWTGIATTYMKQMHVRYLSQRHNAVAQHQKYRAGDADRYHRR